jgi:HK97 family phage prohead protease
MDKTNDLFIRKFFGGELLEVPLEEKGENGDKPIIDMVFTSGTEDGSGDIMEPDGGDFKRFKKNPVVLYAHQRGQSGFFSGGGDTTLPVGKATKIWQNEKKQWVSRILFDKEDEFAMKVYGKYQRGFLKASSIGFKPLEYEYKEDKKSGRITGIHFKKWELAEISLLPIGDNPEALIAAGLGKDGRDELLKGYTATNTDNKKELDMDEKVKAAIDELTGKIDALETTLKEIKTYVDKHAEVEQEKNTKAAVDSIVADIKGMFENIAKEYKSDK